MCSNARLTFLNLNFWLRILCLGLGITAFSWPACAQLNYGRIYGAITDQTGGAVAGATVTVIDTDRGISRALMADDAGEYSASSLLPGNYTVRAEFKGFKVAEHSGLTVGVGQDVRVGYGRGRHARLRLLHAAAMHRVCTGKQYL